MEFNMRKLFNFFAGVVTVLILSGCGPSQADTESSLNSIIESSAKPLVNQFLKENLLLRSTFGTECKSVEIIEKVSSNTYKAIAQCSNGKVMKIQIELTANGKNIIVSPRTN